MDKKYARVENAAKLEGARFVSGVVVITDGQRRTLTACPVPDVTSRAQRQLDKLMASKLQKQLQCGYARQTMVAMHN